MRRTVLCYLQWQNRFLMLHRVRKKDDANHGKWIGVGGGIEPGETPREALIREVFEETGYTLLDANYRGLIHFHSDICEDEQMYLYTSEHFSGTPHPCDEGDLKWIDIEQILSLPLWEGDRIFLPRIFKNDPQFVLFLDYQGDALVAYRFETPDSDSMNL